jgi:deoxyribonuclease-4
MTISFGPAGTGGSSEEAFKKLKEQGFQAAEIEFTYQIWLTPEKAKALGQLNKKLGLKLSIHSPYYINLNSKNKKIIESSKKRILKCCEIGHNIGAKYIVFHIGYYSERTPEDAYENVKTQVKEILDEVKRNKWNVVLCPETTGKIAQFGTLEELLKLRKETGCHICIDFAHLRAKAKGKINYDEIMKKIKHLGYIHAHFSGIEWTDRGEKKHVPTKDSDIKELLKSLIKHKISCTIINESPVTFKDTIKSKEIYESLKQNNHK